MLHNHKKKLKFHLMFQYPRFLPHSSSPRPTQEHHCSIFYGCCKPTEYGNGEPPYCHSSLEIEYLMIRMPIPHDQSHLLDTTAKHPPVLNRIKPLKRSGWLP